MGLARFLGSRWTRRLSLLTALSQAVRELARGNKRVGVLLLSAAALAYRWTPFVLVLELAIRWYRRQKKQQDASNPDGAATR
ncbi:hypothetical protein ACNS7O_13940 [Haloferacaceae archaeon DSL9]